MNWTVFAVLAYVVLAMHKGLAPALAIDTRWGPVQPQFHLLLLVFVGMFATPRATLVAWALMGLMLDLLFVQTHGTGRAATGIVLVGPHTLGLLAAGAVLLQVRTMVLRTHPISHGFCTLVSALAWALVVVLILVIRRWWYGDLPYSAVGDLMLRLVSGLYTAGLAVLIAVPVVRLASAMGTPLHRHGGRR